MSKDETNLNIIINKDLKSKLKIIAKKKDLNISQIIRENIRREIIQFSKMSEGATQ